VIARRWRHHIFFSYSIILTVFGWREKLSLGKWDGWVGGWKHLISVFFIWREWNFYYFDNWISFCVHMSSCEIIRAKFIYSVRHNLCLDILTNAIFGSCFFNRKVCIFQLKGINFSLEMLKKCKCITTTWNGCTKKISFFSYTVKTLPSL